MRNDLLRMSARNRMLARAGSLLTAILVGCTTPNSAFVEDDRGVSPDQSQAQDAALDRSTDDVARRDALNKKDVNPKTDLNKKDVNPKVDLNPKADFNPKVDSRRDAVPSPDTVACPCATSADCDDQRDCTDDVCTPQKTCQNILRPGHCLIDGACIHEGDLDPGDVCRSCKSGIATLDWTAAADGSACTSDGHSCTADVCRGGFCRHEVGPASCFIGGTCFAADAPNPTQGCQTCQPAFGQDTWTALPDGAACASDGLGCTQDVCQAGSCSHGLASGWCVIGNSCYKQGATGLDVCNECVPSRSTTAFTFVAGKPCGNHPAGQIGGMCWQSKCSAWVEAAFDPTIGVNVSSALNGVASIPSGGVWAAGQVTVAGVTGGVLVKVSPSTSTPVPVLAPLRFTGIHHRLAVGDGGQSYYFDGQVWMPHAPLKAAVGSANLAGVWGGPGLLGVDTFWITGFEGATTSGVLRCTVALNQAACEAQTGIAKNVQMGPVGGTTNAVGLGVAWALPSAADDDIYYHGLTGKMWTRNDPDGCQDLGTSTATPCSNSAGDYRDLFVSGGVDAWAVGSSGLLLQYDGVKWKQLPAVLSNQSGQNLDAVFSSPADKLVTIAAHASSGGGRTVALFNYNTDLQRWLGPVTLVASTGTNANDEIRDLGGAGYSNLFAVGTRLGSASGTTPHMTAWVLQLK